MHVSLETFAGEIRKGCRAWRRSQVSSDAPVAEESTLEPHMRPPDVTFTVLVADVTDAIAAAVFAL